MKYWKGCYLFWYSYLEERPESLLKLINGNINLSLAEVHEGACVQSGLQLVRSLQEVCFCHNLADMYDMRTELLRLLRVRLWILQRNQLSTKLLKKEKTENSFSVCKINKEALCKISNMYFFKKEVNVHVCVWNYSRLTANEAPTGLRIHLGGFFICVMVAEGAVDWGSWRGGKVCPVPNGSMFPNEVLICNGHTRSHYKWSWVTGLLALTVSDI